MREERQVAVTGVGAVCGLGWGVAPLWAGLRAGEPAIGPFHRFDHSRHRTHIAAEAAPASAAPAALARSCPGWRRLSIADRFAVFAALEALGGAGLAELTPPSLGEDGEGGWEGDLGVYFGSSTGGMYESELFFADFLRDRRHPRLSSLIPQQVNAPGDAVARQVGATGPVITFSSACASGALALGAALAAVRAGEVEVAVAGGSDSLCQLTYAGFNALRSVDEVPCRPFRADRAGMSFGEGAAVLVLEPLERALARGARPLALLAGAGASCDAHHMTAPDPAGSGAAAAVEAALADAGLAAAEIDFVNVHGTGTPLNDAAEWQALRRVFGERAEDLPLVATKALIGHLLGCSGAIEAVATVLCLNRGELHPVRAAGDADTELPVSLVLDQPLSLPEARAAVSTSLAFGGSNAALVFSRWPDQPDRRADRVA
jgi:3-oxoacyl-(acyl-carrier-protein) synthase